MHPWSYARDCHLLLYLKSIKFIYLSWFKDEKVILMLYAWTVCRICHRKKMYVCKKCIFQFCEILKKWVICPSCFITYMSTNNNYLLVLTKKTFQNQKVKILSKSFKNEKWLSELTILTLCPFHPKYFVHSDSLIPFLWLSYL